MIEYSIEKLAEDIDFLSRLTEDGHSIIKVLPIRNMITFEEKYQNFSALFQSKGNAPFSFISIDCPLLSLEQKRKVKGTYKNSNQVLTNNIFGIETYILNRDRLFSCSFPKDRILIFSRNIKTNKIKIADNSFGSIQLMK